MRLGGTGEDNLGVVGLRGERFMVVDLEVFVKREEVRDDPGGVETRREVEFPGCGG